MNKWKYKYSFISGILFILSFLLKELILNSPKGFNSTIFISTYFFMILYLNTLLFGYIKYSVLNENFLLKFSTIALAIFYSAIIIIELLERIFVISNISYHFILIPKMALTLSLLYFGIILFVKKSIYGKKTLFQGIVAVFFSITIIVPQLFLIQLPMFLVFFISITYLINKKVST